jgi:hypothetical protein
MKEKVRALSFINCDAMQNFRPPVGRIGSGVALVQQVVDEGLDLVAGA